MPSFPIKPAVFYLMIMMSFFFTLSGCNKDNESDPISIPHYGWHHSMEGDIIFVRFDENVPYPFPSTGELLMINKEGTTELSAPQSNGIRYEIDVSPNGSLLAYGVVDKIYVVEIESLHAEDFDLANMFAMPVSWSPDGSAIAFIARDGSFARKIGILDYASGDIQYYDIDTDMNVYGEYIDWTPDGATIAYGKDESIWTFNVSNAETSELIGEKMICYYLEWAPDGRLFFDDIENNEDGVWDVMYHMHQNGSGRSSFLNLSHYGRLECIWDICFSPDGNFIACAASS